MHETGDDLARLQELLDLSMARAGAHLRRIVTPARRLEAAEVCRRLDGMRLLALATVTADGRPLVSPVDGIFYRGAFHFGSAPDSVKVRHLRARPQVSATHLPGEHFAVTVHGTASIIDTAAAAHAGFRRTLLDMYVPRYGTEWEDFLDTQTVYARINAVRMFVFAMDADRAAGAGPGRAPPEVR
jgi:nitroimidazol reductase NimA-like FMN-containing flavoprotein (pyridoxamine 5'-phosphate oxidase superfamily)